MFKPGLINCEKVNDPVTAVFVFFTKPLPLPNINELISVYDTLGEKTEPPSRLDVRASEGGKGSRRFLPV